MVLLTSYYLLISLIQLNFLFSANLALNPSIQTFQNLEALNHGFGYNKTPTIPSHTGKNNRDDIIIFEEGFDSGTAGWSIGPGWEHTTADYYSGTYSMFSAHSNLGKNSTLTSPLIQLPDAGLNDIMYFRFFLNLDMPDSDGDNDEFLDDYYQVQLRDNSNKVWHISDYNINVGNGYWCGDENINGYKDAWIQFIDTPTISIAEAGYTLTAKMMWKIESPDPYPDGSFVDGSCTDGWDAINIRISTDGGNNWVLLEDPDTPYDFDCGYGWIYNDSEYEISESLHHLARGWGGDSNGWQNYSVDLSAYEDQNIIIRFAFGSDPEFATDDDSSLKGFFVDDITIKDESDTAIVSYTAEDGDNDLMTISGYSLENLLSPPDYYTYEVQFCYDPLSLNILDSYTNEGDCESNFYDWFVSPGSMGWEASNLVDLDNYGGRDVNFVIRSIYDNNNDGGQGDGLYIDDFLLYKLSTVVYYAPWGLNAQAGSGEVALSWADMNASGTETFIYDTGEFEEANTLYMGQGSGWVGKIFNIIGSSTINTVSIYNINSDASITIGAFQNLGFTYDIDPIYSMSADLTSGWNNISISAWEMDNPFIIAYQINEFFGGAMDTSVTMLQTVVQAADAWEYALSYGYLGEFGIRANITYAGAGVTYDVYRDNSKIASELTENTYIDLSVENYVTYEYAVSATYSPDGEESDKSSPVTATSFAISAHEESYDDGTFEGGECTDILYTSQDSCEANNKDWGFNAGSSNFSAVRFSASSAGEDIMFFKWYQDGSGGAFYIKIFEDNEGEPGNELHSVVSAGPVNSDGWNSKDLSAQGLNVSGDFWIGTKEFGTTLPFGLDTGSNAGVSYQRDGSSGDWIAVSGNIGYRVYLDCGSDNTLDECNICGGDNSSCADECGIPNGDNSSCADCSGVLNGADGPEYECCNTSIACNENECYIDGGEVWPGNTNADNIVNANDLLPIGIYWNQLACERSIWADDMYKWQSQFLVENNCISHADANGDGKVDIADVLVIMVNWQKVTFNSNGFAYEVDNSCSDIDDLSRYYSNFSKIYYSLAGNSDAEIQMRSKLEELFDFSPTPSIYQIHHNYPNPFNPSTAIPYYLSKKSEVSLSVFDLMGRRVMKKGSYLIPEGSHEIIINGHNLSTGIYFYQFTIDGNKFMPMKMILLK